MRILAPLMFVVVAISGLIGLTFAQSVIYGGPADGQGVVKSMISRVISDLSPEAKAKEIDLADFMPEAPEGWFAKPYQTEDGEALTQATYRRSAVKIDDTNTLLAEFDRGKEGARGAAMTYLRGDRRVLLVMTMRSERDMNSIHGSIMTAISGQLSGAGLGDWNDNDFARLYGVTFKEGDRENTVIATRTTLPVNYRDFSASMGGQLSITVLTNASDADVAKIIQSIDVLGLNEGLVQPDPRVTPASGFLTREEGRLDTTPPPPSSAYQAFKLLRSGNQLPANDARFLTLVAEFEISSWEETFETYGMTTGISDAALAVLGERPVVSAEERRRYSAIFLLRDEERWLEHEADLLKAFERGRITTQKQFDRYFDQEKIYDPEIIELSRGLPQEERAVETVDVTQAEAGAVPVIRRAGQIQQGAVSGSNCTTEIGVRRCTVGAPTDGDP